jgi:hypothetical protein
MVEDAQGVLGAMLHLDVAVHRGAADEVEIRVEQRPA